MLTFKKNTIGYTCAVLLLWSLFSIFGFMRIPVSFDYYEFVLYFEVR